MQSIKQMKKANTWTINKKIRMKSFLDFLSINQKDTQNAHKQLEILSMWAVVIKRYSEAVG